MGRHRCGYIQMYTCAYISVELYSYIYLSAYLPTYHSISYHLCIYLPVILSITSLSIYQIKERKEEKKKTEHGEELPSQSFCKPSTPAACIPVRSRAPSAFPLACAADKDVGDQLINHNHGGTWEQGRRISIAAGSGLSPLTALL